MPGSISETRRAPAFACAVAVLGVLLLLAAAVRVSRADAAFIHPNPPSEAFGVDGTSGSEFSRGGGGLAVNPVTHRLYGYQNSNSNLYGFEIPTPGTHTALGGKFPVYAGPEFGGGVEKSAVAVDTENGNIYTTDKHELWGFNAAGETLPGFPITSGLSEPGGVSTDAHGNVWVADSTEKQIREYSPQGEILRVINTSSIYEPEFGAGTAQTIAVDKSTGDLYFTLSLNYGVNRIVWRLTAASGYAVGAVEEFVVNPTYPGITDISIDSSRHVIYLAEGSKVDAYNTSGVLLEEFGTTMESVTVAVDESTGIVYASVFNEPSHQIQVLDPVIVPDALTGEPTGDSQVSGTVGTAGGPTVSSCEFEWGPTAAYGEAPVPCSPGPPYGNSNTVTASLPGLSKETTYHYRLVATNANGTNIGIDRTITPHHVPFLRTTGATEIERNCVKLNGAYDGNGEDTHFNFEWGTTSSYGNKVFNPDEDAGSGTGPQVEFDVLCGLTPATTYHYRITASNGAGSSVGKDSTFTTENAVLGISTDPATEIGGVKATINGHWTGDGSTTSYYFEWGFGKAYGNKTAVVQAGAGTGLQNGSAELDGLFQNTVYHYRIVVTGGSGTTAGPDRSFRTLILATFAYEPTNKLTTESAEVHATVNPENAGPTTYHFEYGPTESYGNETPESGSVGSDNKPHPAEGAISGLSAGQTYHFRVVATSPAGTSDGADQTFTAAPNLPTVVSQSAISVGATEASLAAEARPGFGPTVVFFRFGTGGELSSHSLTSAPLGADDSPHSVTLGISGLQPGTVYEYRAVAVNIAGSSVGPIETFTTSDRPAVEVSGVSNITETGATLSGRVIPNRAATTYHFEYWSGSGAHSSSAVTSAGSDGTSHSVSAAVSGLRAGTAYHYVVVATNSIGSTTSSEGGFATNAAQPGGGGKKVTCKKGFIKKHGKCVKKPKKKHKKSHGKAHRNG